MYFPILRGKQYELLALKEFAIELNKFSIISPVIEPVKLPFKTLEASCKQLSQENVNFTIIVNPSVGDIKNYEVLLRQILVTPCLNGNKNYQLGIHGWSQHQLSEALGTLSEFDLHEENLIVIYHDLLEKEFCNRINRDFHIKYNLIQAKIKSKKFKHFFEIETRIDLDDVFEMKERNSDYQKQVDELFSEAPFWFRDEGFSGFSDYLTIGEEYSEGGFLPYAIAIHLTYLTDDSVRIRHFVSDSNDDYHDTPGKFMEALDKLVSFTSGLSYKTKAIRTFEGYYNDQHYPGLGSIKKLSILNHLELMNYLLSNKAQ